MRKNGQLKRAVKGKKAKAKFTKARAAKRRSAKHNGRPKDRQQRGKMQAADVAPWHYGKPLIGPLIEDHSDERGRFVTVENARSFQHPIGAVAVLTRKAGSVFAEHRHANEGHTCMLVSGSAEYHERNATGRVAPVRMFPFVPLFTPPDVDHAFLALEDCTVVVIANIARTQASYEQDVIRLKGDERLISEERRLAACPKNLPSSENALVASPSSAKLSSAVADSSTGVVTANADEK